VGEFTALFPFGGSGGGALGFLDAEDEARTLARMDFEAMTKAAEAEKGRER
jgi:GTPase involved in cell partitioning and DNA repair